WRMAFGDSSPSSARYHLRRRSEFFRINELQFSRTLALRASSPKKVEEFVPPERPWCSGLEQDCRRNVIRPAPRRTRRPRPSGQGGGGAGTFCCCAPPRRMARALRGPRAAGGGLRGPSTSSAAAPGGSSPAISRSRLDPPSLLSSCRGTSLPVGSS